MARGKKIARRQRSRRVNRWALGIVISVIIIAVAGMIAWLGPQSTGVGGQKITSPEQVQRITPADAKALVDAGSAVLFDTRSDEAYQAKHIVGALSFPEAEQETLVGMLPADKTLIFY
ncbi:MAG: hypothetical protein A2Y73_01330 [Chloroflexi bacterium RBG_13_56_8]|nr:MAG: hypothetical protein A2Y73_01330 [Chloroflexi bacterium RBG_13_56_8]